MIGFAIALAYLSQPVDSAVNTLYTSTDLDCLALNIYHEARDESTAGRMAVSQVVLNRVKSRQFPSTVCDVVTQGPKRGGIPLRDMCQFSWYCDARTDRPFHKKSWENSRILAEFLLISHPFLPDITDGSLYYHAEYVSPRWSKTRRKMARIDRHLFYQ